MGFVWETSAGLFSLLLKVFLIVVPLMVLLEIFREYKIIDKLIIPFRRPAGAIGFKQDSIYPLLAGIIFGISYGGGVLIGESASGRIKGNQKFLVALYLGLCHAVFEDTLIFMSLGANGAVVLPVRLVLATGVVFMAAIILKEK